MREREETDQLQNRHDTDSPQALLRPGARRWAVTCVVEKPSPGVVGPMIAREPMTASPTCEWGRDGPWLPWRWRLEVRRRFSAR